MAPTPQRRNVLLVDGSYAGQTVNVPTHAKSWEFRELARIDIGFDLPDEPAPLQYVHTVYHFHECTILGVAIVLGWCGETPTQAALAKHLLSREAWKSSIPPKPDGP